MLNIGPQELLLILVVALLIVGPRRLPELGRSLGKGMREIRKAQTEVRRTIQENLEEEPRPTFSSRSPASEAPGADGEQPEVPDGAPTPTSDRSDVEDISRSLGRGLSELRRTREEIRRSFRVDLGRVDPGREDAGRADRPAAKPSRRSSAPRIEETGSADPVPPEDAPGGDPPPE